MKQYTLVDLQTFAAVVETESFKLAADRLHTSPATVSRRIAALEQTLGVRLLSRTTRQVRLTDAGRQYVGDVQYILDALQASEDKLRDEGAAITGHMRLAVPMSFGVQVVAPLLPAFLKQHPELHIELRLEDEITDLHSAGIDLALRIGELADSSLVATHLCDLPFGFFASPAYLRRYGEPKSPEELSQHQCLHYTLVNPTQEWQLQNHAIKLKGALSANNGDALCEAAVRGLGIVALPRFVVEKYLLAGQLTPVLQAFVPPATTLSAVRLSRRFTPARVTLLTDYLRQALTEPTPSVL